jgi:hypothetical protein
MTVSIAGAVVAPGSRDVIPGRVLFGGSGATSGGRRAAKGGGAALAPDLRQAGFGIGALDGFGQQAGELVDIEAGFGDGEDDSAVGRGLPGGHLPDFLLLCLVLLAALLGALLYQRLLGLDLCGEIDGSYCHGSLLGMGEGRLRQFGANGDGDFSARRRRRSSLRTSFCRDSGLLRVADAD